MGWASLSPHPSHWARLCVRDTCNQVTRLLNWPPGSALNLRYLSRRCTNIMSRPSKVVMPSSAGALQLTIVSLGIPSIILTRVSRPLPGRLITPSVSCWETWARLQACAPMNGRACWTKREIPFAACTQWATMRQASWADTIPVEVLPWARR